MTPKNSSRSVVTVRLSAEEKAQLMARSGVESRSIGQMARVLILQGLKCEEHDQQPHSTSVAAG